MSPLTFAIFDYRYIPKSIRTEIKVIVMINDTNDEETEAIRSELKKGPEVLEKYVSSGKISVVPIKK